MAGFILAAPASHSGKTTLMLALLRRLSREGIKLTAAKAGPDYIDGAFYRFALRQSEEKADIGNLDCWAMRPALLRALAAQAVSGGRLLAVEGMMGLFDGAANGQGSAADLAHMLGLPVILALDCRYMGQSAAALAQGFCHFDRQIRIAALILNKVGSERHEAMLRAALAAAGAPPILAVLRRDARLTLPERHLGLVQAQEQAEQPEAVIGLAAQELKLAADWRQILGAENPETEKAPALPLLLSLPLNGRHIAIAADNAFRFVYPHFLEQWRQAGRQISFFSPLADEMPAAGADCVFLPGGYPELYAAELAAAGRFKAAMRAFAARGGTVYGECGGYMALGDALCDAAGRRHEMLGLLPIETDFSRSRLHLGYRRLVAQADFFGAGKQLFRGHEFHYAGFAPGRDEASALQADKSGRLKPLWQAADSQGQALGAAGLRLGRVCGSFIHIIDAEG